MDLQTLVAWTTVIGSLAVTLTLVVLIVSIRQNTKAQRVLAVQSLTAAIAAIDVPAMTSPELGAALTAVLKDWRTATREQRIVAHYFLFPFFKLLETAWYQERAGVLEPALWSGWDAMIRVYFHSKGIKEVWWPVRGRTFSPEFQRYLEQTEPPTVGSLADLFD